METAKQYNQWEKLYKCIDEAPLKHPVDQWFALPQRNSELYTPMHIWPIIKSQFLLRAVNYFHSETGPERVLIPESERLKEHNKFLSKTAKATTNLYQSQNYLEVLEAFQKKLPNIGFSRLPRSWGKHHSDILFFGSGMCNYSIGPYNIQNHVDPLRLALEQSGYRTSTYLLDVTNDDPSLRKAFLGGTHGFKKEFTEARTIYANGGLFDFEGLPGFTEFFNELQSEFDIESILTPTIVSKVIHQTVSTYQIFRDFLRQQNVKAVFTYCYYGIAGNALAHACREIGIPFTDIQHGVAGQGHESYSWPNAPKNGYSTLPNYFLTWTEQEANFVNQNRVGQYPVAINTGHSWRLTESLLTEHQSILPLANGDRLHSVRRIFEEMKNITAQSFKNSTKSKRNILIATYPNEPLNWVSEVVKKAPNDWQFFLRLHPGEAMNEGKLELREEELGPLNVSVRVPTKLPVPVLMPHMDLVINKYSSIVRDAAAYGVPSLCYSLSSKWYHSPDIYDGVHIVDHSAAAILGGIKSVFNKTDDLMTPRPTMTQQTLGKTLKEIVQSDSF